MVEPITRTVRRPLSLLREFLDSEASGGLLLMGAAAAALIVANSALAPAYHGALHAYLGPMSVGHWINDGLMAVFFLLVGLEIKREMLDGQLASWGRRTLPGIAALGGMAVPALIYVGFAHGDPEALRGWAVPAATDIAFALGVISLLGQRVPASLKIFLAALAILDDLGAVVIIAIFYTDSLSLLALGADGVILVLLFLLNRAGTRQLWPYLLLGALLWFFMLQSGVHATLAGVLLALCIPLRHRPGGADDTANSPLHRLEHGLTRWVNFLILPIFGFANAGVSFVGMSPEALLGPVSLGVGLGLFIGKQIGVFGGAWLAVKLGVAERPAGATWPQIYGTALLCGIGFTMSLFIGLLAFPTHPEMQDAVKIGVLGGSVVSALCGAALLRVTGRALDARGEAVRVS